MAMNFVFLILILDIIACKKSLSKPIGHSASSKLVNL